MLPLAPQSLFLVDFGVKKGRRVGIGLRNFTDDQAHGENSAHDEFRALRSAEFNDRMVLKIDDLAGVSGKPDGKPAHFFHRKHREPAPPA